MGKTKQHGHSILLFALTFAAIILFSSEAQAANLAKILRKAAGVADDIPVRRIDDVVQEATTSRAGREILEKLNAGKRLDNVVEESAALRRAWKEILESGEGHLLREIEELPLPRQRAALVLARGGQRLKSVVPDLAVRTRWLREGGAETLAALGRFDDLADDAVRFDLALQAGKLPSPPGLRALTLNDFGKFFHNLGDRAQHFWNTYVRPHWKLWLGSAALAAILLAPEEYLDEIGNLTEKGLEKVGHFAGETLSRALRGTIQGLGEGAKEIVTETTRTIFETFFTSLAGVVSASLLALVVLLVIPRTRRWLFGKLRRIFRAPRPADSLPTSPST